jgi:hypothetical protein
MSAKKENDVMGLCLRERIRHSIFVCLALVTMVSLFLLTTVNVQAETVTINDQSGVLDAGRVQAEAAKLSVPMLIFTTNTFTGNQDALNASTREQLPDQDTIAIGIDTVHRNLSIEAGTNVSLSDSDASDAVSAFQSNIDNGGDYTSATIAAMDSVQNALNPYQYTGVLIVIGGVVCIGVFFYIAFIRQGSGHGAAIQDDEPTQGNWLVSQIKNSKVAAIFGEHILCRIGMHQGTWTREGRSSCLQSRFCMYCGLPQQRERHDWPFPDSYKYIEDGSCETMATCLRCGKTKFTGKKHESLWGSHCPRCGEYLGGDGGDGGGGGHDGGGGGGHF